MITKEDESKCLKAIEILQAFHDGNRIEAFYETATGFQKVFTLGALFEAMYRNRSIRVLDPKDLNKVIMRY